MHLHVCHTTPRKETKEIKTNCANSFLISLFDFRKCDKTHTKETHKETKRSTKRPSRPRKRPNTDIKEKASTLCLDPSPSLAPSRDTCQKKGGGGTRKKHTTIGRQFWSFFSPFSRSATVKSLCVLLDPSRDRESVYLDHSPALSLSRLQTEGCRECLFDCLFISAT